MATNEAESTHEKNIYCLCEIKKDKTNFICVNCNKLCVLHADDSTNTSNNYSNKSINILTIDQPFENKLDYFIKKKKCQMYNINYIYIIFCYSCILIIHCT